MLTLLKASAWVPPAFRLAPPVLLCFAALQRIACFKKRRAKLKERAASRVGLLVLKACCKHEKQRFFTKKASPLLQEEEAAPTLLLLEEDSTHASKRGFF